MKNCLLTLIFIPFLVLSQDGPIEVQLTDYSADKIPADCGYQTEWGILKFRLNEPTEDLKIGETIFVLFQCPRETIGVKIGLGNFINGNSYFLTLGEKVERTESPLNTTELFTDSQKDYLPLYWMTEVEKKK